MFKLFKDKEFFKQVLQIALPIAMQNLLVASFALIDTIMVGQIGDVALSAVGMAGAVVTHYEHGGVRNIVRLRRVYRSVLGQ